MVNDFAREIIKVAKPKKADIRMVRILICLGLVGMIIFLSWFINPQHIGNAYIFWFLTFALLFKLVKMLHEWYHYWSVGIPETPSIKTNHSVDILTTACPGEPQEMIIRTLKAMVAVRYPHTNYLCDEGNDPVLKEICDELGVIHVTRLEKTDAKAGNINNALKQAKGDICVVLDPDHVPIPEFLDRVLPYFEDSLVGFVQCVQGYSNQSESIIARGAAEQTYHFYGPMMMCMNTYGTVQAIGANCTFRRAALDSIGGHAAGLSEDMHTAMQLHAKGWKSVYIPEILTRGLVPATLSSYYKQQLKWSRGTFELLFRTYPRLYKNFTWRQKLHYFTIPLYFLFGLINLIDIAIPLVALFLAEVPWEVNIAHFALFYFPLCGLSMIIRLYAQRWLLEKHERGFHLAGGVLRTATWWIFLIGFIYTIFKIKVPYIPTPKEDEHCNYWRLSLPNIIVSLLCIVVILYGLSIDWTPYSFAMASYGLLNAIMLIYIALMSQQKFLLNINNSIKKIPPLSLIFRGFSTLTAASGNVAYHIVRNGPVALLIAGSLAFLSYSSIENDEERMSSLKPKEIGGFYMGTYIQDKENLLTTVNNLEKRIKANINVVSIDEDFSKFRNLNSFKILNEIGKCGGIPMINWKPMKDTTGKIYEDISNGRYDDYLQHSAEMFRKFKSPVFLSFDNGFDQMDQKPVNSKNLSAKFIVAWQYIYTFLNDLGVSNLTWVWNPRYATSASFYPGEKFVDWIGVSCLNYGDNVSDNDWYSFSQLYTTYRKSYGAYQKPVIITEFGTSIGPDQPMWVKDGLKDIAEKYHEIKSLIVCDSKKHIKLTNGLYTTDFNMNPLAVAEFKSQMEDGPFNENPLLDHDISFLKGIKSDYTSPFVKGSRGNFNLVIDNQSYYIRGVAYNTAHDWRDGNMPLTRRQLVKDFSRIKEMGANVIRRYDYGIYDRNVLNIAHEFDLKVLYGFWFDPKIDYYKDTLRVKEYIDDIEKKVMAYKDHPAILAWTLGNETWGLLKHRYSKPYLIKVREHYIMLVEKLAQRIHELDPTRPVFSCIEHEEYQLPGELVAFRDGAPSVDIMGINSYYQNQIKKLNHVFNHFDSIRPYIISEFGPNGYWDPTYNRVSNGLLVEDDDKQKGEWYKQQWKDYVLEYKGYNLGGFAYCWHDRMEGSNTWFGLTDFKGRTKPAYYALKEVWTGKKNIFDLRVSVNGPKYYSPGKEYIFKAVVENWKSEEVEYEWYLNQDEYLERVDNIEYINSGESVKVTIPIQPSVYRLYLYVSNKNGEVGTASFPIKVTEGNLQ